MRLALLHQNLVIQILCCLTDIFWLAEIAPIIFVGAEGSYFFALSSETQVSVMIEKTPSSVIFVTIAVI